MKKKTKKQSSDSQAQLGGEVSPSVLSVETSSFSLKYQYYNKVCAADTILALPPSEKISQVTPMSRLHDDTTRMTAECGPRIIRFKTSAEDFQCDEYNV